MILVDKQCDDNQKSYTWGRDDSGSINGAGGTQGLIGIHDHITGKHYIPTYHNMNVSKLIDADDGSVVASYEYSPFGLLLKKEGQAKDINPFLHHTKYYDSKYGLYYYGYRYYDPSSGRWLSREPLGEGASLNLYRFAGNDPVNVYDLLGLADKAKRPVMSARKVWTGKIIPANTKIIHTGLFKGSFSYPVFGYKWVLEAPTFINPKNYTKAARKKFIKNNQPNKPNLVAKETIKLINNYPPLTAINKTTAVIDGAVSDVIAKPVLSAGADVLGYDEFAVNVWGEGGSDIFINLNQTNAQASDRMAFFAIDKVFLGMGGVSKSIAKKSIGELDGILRLKVGDITDDFFDIPVILNKNSKKTIMRQTGSSNCCPTAVGQLVDELIPNSTVFRATKEFLLANSKGGFYIDRLKPILIKNGLDNYSWSTGGIKALEKMVAGGKYPAIVSVKAGKINHAILVDAIIISKGIKYVKFRDPGRGGAFLMELDHFIKIFNNQFYGVKP